MTSTRSQSRAEVRDAATVILLRSEQKRLEAFLVQRASTMAFMAGAFVFPGGAVDDADRGPQHSSEDPWSLAVRNAATRETHEEAGVSLEMDELIRFSRWITPTFESRRFDARFFLAALPETQKAQHDGQETVDSMWIAPSEAIERHQRGAILLPPPTLRSLETLTRFASVTDALGFARSRPPPTFAPERVERDGRTLLVLEPREDDDPTPSERRPFYLVEGRFVSGSAESV